MMTWIFIAIASYFILAIVNIIDKFVLGNVIPNSRAYTFFVGVFGALLVVIAPWYLVWPGTQLFFINIIVGAFFPMALIFMYRSLKVGDTSRMITLVGGCIPIFTILLSVIFLKEHFTNSQWIGIFFLFLGTVLISWLPNKKTMWHKFSIWFGLTEDDRKKGIWEAILSAFFYALFFIGTKYSYSHQPFISGFIWIRLGTLLLVLSFLINKADRKGIFDSLKAVIKNKSKFIFLGGQGLAGVGFILQNYAISLGSVALVNAMQGVQYVFLLILGAIATMFMPSAVKEDISKRVIIEKVIAIILVGIGLYFIAR